MVQLEDYIDKSAIRWCKGIFSVGVIAGLAGVIADSEALTIYGGVFAVSGIWGYGMEYIRAGMDYVIKENEAKKQ
ncbi:hypothetical protein J4468_00150 [Candidatus Woesearchaeota archaeon]|nr:hypothetical protein [Candidatus Woesearchaeota archaeon]